MSVEDDEAPGECRATCVCVVQEGFRTNRAITAICEKCLGTNPYLRMSREVNGEECKLCTRPFTVFKWAAERHEGMRKTVICLTCSRQRNCCQSCLLDLTYGIPIQLRDSALKLSGLGSGAVVDYAEPKNEMTKLYVANNEDKFKRVGGANITGDAQKAQEVLTKLAMVVNSTAKPKKKDTLGHTSTSSRLDKVDVSKIVAKLPFNGSLSPPQDGAITSFFVFGLDESLPEYKLADVFEQFGELRSIKVQHSSKCGFVTFKSRTAAESFAEHYCKPGEASGKPGTIVVDNIPVRVCWGRERPMGSNSVEKAKIGVIVGKFLKKLARDEVKAASPAQGVRKGAASGAGAGSSTARDTTGTYQAASKNYEL